MTDVEHLEKQIQGSASRWDPPLWALAAGGGCGSGVVVAPGRVLTTARDLRGGHRRDEDVKMVFTLGSSSTPDGSPALTRTLTWP